MVEVYNLEHILRQTMGDRASSDVAEIIRNEYRCGEGERNKQKFTNSRYRRIKEGCLYSDIVKLMVISFAVIYKWLVRCVIRYD